MGKFWEDYIEVGWGKMACWSTKRGNISETCKDQKLLRRAYRNSPTHFRTVPSPTPLSPYGLPFPKIGGSQPRTKTAIARPIISGTGRPLKLRIANLADTFTESIRTKPMKNLGEKRAWAYSRDSANFLSTPIIPGMGKATNFRILYAHSQDRSKQKHIKNFGKSSCGRILRDCQKFSGHP